MQPVTLAERGVAPSAAVRYAKHRPDTPLGSSVTSQSLRASTLISLAASLAVGFAAIFHFGADANWDLRNYHLYNAYALLEGRLGIDVFPMLQAYLNPALDVPFYLAVVHLGIYPAHGLLGLYFGLFVWVVFLFNRHLLLAALPASRPGTVLALAVAATAVGVTGAAGASQAITTFNEIQTALLVVASIALVLPDAEGRPPRARRIALAGLLMGLAVGLKLTAMVYLVGACAALLPWRLRREEIRALVVYGLAAAAGILASHGAWSWVLYQRFGNPVFPFFNAIFRSPWESPHNFADMRFFPATAWGYLTYPLDWAVHPSTAISELPFRDPRLALLLGSAFVLLVIHLTLWRQARAVLLVVGFAVVSYAVWLVRFSILRYGVPLEVMAGALLVLVVAAPLRAGLIAPVLASCLAALSAITLVAYTHWPDWGRIPLAEGYRVAMPPIAADATVILAGVPVSHVVPFLPEGRHRFIGLNGWSTAEGPRREAAVAALSHASGPVWALVVRDQGVDGLLAEIGWATENARCTPVHATLDPGRIDLCPVVPAADAATTPARGP